MGCFSIQPFSVLPVTNKQFFTLKKEHQTRLIPLRDAKHPLIFSVRLRLNYENFDSPFGLPQGDQVGALPSIYGMPHTADVKNSKLFLELLCLFVTLSKAGCTVLSKGTHSKTPAASNLDEWR